MHFTKAELGHLEFVIDYYAKFDTAPRYHADKAIGIENTAAYERLVELDALITKVRRYASGNRSR